MDPKSTSQAPAAPGKPINNPAPPSPELFVPKRPTCKYCSTPVKDDFIFCPHCGKNIKEVPFKFSFFRTLGLIIFSVLLPPLGLIPGFMYLHKKETTAKIIGLILIIISITITAAIVWFLVEMYNQMSRFWMDLYEQQGGKATYENVTPENVMNQLNSLQQISR